MNDILRLLVEKYLFPREAFIVFKLSKKLYRSTISENIYKNYLIWKYSLKHNIESSLAFPCTKCRLLMDPYIDHDCPLYKYSCYNNLIPINKELFENLCEGKMFYKGQIDHHVCKARCKSCHEIIKTEWTNSTSGSGFSRHKC